MTVFPVEGDQKKPDDGKRVKSSLQLVFFCLLTLL